MAESVPPKLEDLEALSTGPQLEDLELIPKGQLDPSLLDSAVNFGKDFARQQKAVATQLGVGGLQSLSAIDHQFANTAMILDKGAEFLSEKTGLSHGGAFKHIERWFRKEANALRTLAERHEQTNLTSKALQLAGGLPGGVAEATLAAKTVGIVPGLAALGALSEADRGTIAAAKGAATGAAMGSVFKAVSPPGAGRLATAGTIGSGVTAVAAASGAPPEEALLSGASLALLGAGGAKKFRESQLRTLEEIRAAKPRVRRVDEIAERPFLQVRPRVITGGEVEAVETKFLGRDYADITPPDKVLNLNLNRIRGPQDYKQAITEVVGFFRNNLDESRRGVIADQQMRAMAEDLNLTPEQLLSKPTGKNFESPEWGLAARYLNASTMKYWFDLAKKGQQGKLSDEGKLEFLKATAIVEDTLGVTLSGAAEAARTLRMHREMVGGSTRQMKKIRDMIRDFKGDKKAASLEEFMDVVAQAESPQQLAQLAESIRKPTIRDKFKFAYVNFLVSGPQTHVVNIVSNTSMALWAIPETFVGGAMDSVRSGLSIARGRGPTKDRVFIREAWIRTHALAQSAKDGLILAGKALKTGRPQIGSKVEQQQTLEAFSGPFGAVLGSPTRLLFAEDALFQMVGYRQEVNARIMRRALGEGKRGAALAERVAEMKREIPPDIDEAGRHAARVQTFTNELGETGRAFSKIIGRHPAAFVFFPFIRTPTNIFKQAARRTPAQTLLMEQSRAEVAKGGAAATMERARMVFSTGAMVMLAEAMADGRITGSGPSDPDLRRVWLDQNQPFSLWVGNNEDGSKRWFAYGRIAPLSILLGMTADMVSLTGFMSDKERESIADGLTMSFRKNVTNQTFLQGMSTLVKAWEDPERGLPDLMEKVVGSLTVPTFVAQLARTQDPVLKDVQNVLDAVKSRTPGWSPSVPNQTNVWGEDISFESGLGPAYDFVSPFYSKKTLPDKASNEAFRLQAKFSRPQRKFGDFELTPQEYHDVSQRAGRVAKQLIDDYVNSATYDATPAALDPIKRETMEEHYANARNLAMQELIARTIKADPKRGFKMQTERTKAGRLARELGVLP
jgi:hypothetical protein